MKCSIVTNKEIKK